MDFYRFRSLPRLQISFQCNLLGNQHSRSIFFGEGGIHREVMPASDQNL